MTFGETAVFSLYLDTLVFIGDLVISEGPISWTFIAIDILLVLSNSWPMSARRRGSPSDDLYVPFTSDSLVRTLGY